MRYPCTRAHGKLVTPLATGIIAEPKFFNWNTCQYTFKTPVHFKYVLKSTLWEPSPMAPEHLYFLHVKKNSWAILTIEYIFQIFNAVDWISQCQCSCYWTICRKHFLRNELGYCSSLSINLNLGISHFLCGCSLVQWLVYWTAYREIKGSNATKGINLLRL